MKGNVQKLYENLAHNIFMAKENRLILASSSDLFPLNNASKKIFHRFLIIELLAKNGWQEAQKFIMSVRQKKVNPKDIRNFWGEMDKAFPHSLFMIDNFADKLYIDENTVEELINTLENDFSHTKIIYAHEKITGTTKRKKEGVFYTPPSIVDYIVDVVLSPVIQAWEQIICGGNKDQLKKLKEKFKKIRILDPSCGSGVFLVAVAQRLQSLYKLFNNRVMKYQLDSLVIKSPAIFIAKYNLFGFDIDKIAVEFTIFNLLTKLGEQNWDIINKVYSHLRENISLKSFLEYSSIEQYDIVLGNPPYVSNKEIDPAVKKLIKGKFKSAIGQFDLIVPFLEGALGLLKTGGKVGYILPNKYLAADYGTALRKYILNQHTLEQIVDLSTVKVFGDASVYPIIQVITKRKPKQDHVIKLYEVNQDIDLNEMKKSPKAIIPQAFFQRANYLITSDLDADSYLILEKILAHRNRINSIDIQCGIARSGFAKNIIDIDYFNSLSKADKTQYKRIIQVSNIAQYHINDDYKYIHQEITAKKQWLSFNSPKLLIAGIGKKVTAAIDYQGSALGRVYYIREDSSKFDLHFLLGLFNSKIVQFFYHSFFWPVHLEGGYLRFNSTYLAQIPIPEINQDYMKRIARIAKELERNKMTHKTAAAETSIKAELDHIIGQSYGLGSEEIKYIQNKMEAQDGTSKRK